MTKEKLKETVKELSQEERDDLQDIVINGINAEPALSSFPKLRRLGLLRWHNFLLSTRRKIGDLAAGEWIYCGGPLGELFQVLEELT